jgi:hypothetical protein
MDYSGTTLLYSKETLFMSYINFDNNQVLIYDQFKDCIYPNLINVMIIYNNDIIWLRVLKTQIKEY